MATTKDIKLPYPTEGVIRSAQLNDTVAPENAIELAVNMNFDRIGAIQTRLGISTYASALAGAIIAFGTLSIQATAVRRLLAQVADDIFSWDGATWTTVRGLSGSTKARFSQFLNLTFMVNGNSTIAGTDNPASFDGTTFGTTNVPASLPKGDYIQAGFEGRIWVADKALDRLYYTDIVQPVGAGYVITANTPCDFIEKFSPQDGQSITGLFRIQKALLVFKQNNIYRVYGASSVDPYPAYYVGTYSQESIVQAKDGIYFHHSSGFYKFAYDSQPIEISRRVKDFVDNIQRSNYENVVGIFDGKDAVEWAVGSVTVSGVTFSNCIMRYTISTQVWTIYDVNTESPKAMVLYDDGTNIIPVVGTGTGKVGKLNDGNTDFGLPIIWEFITGWVSFIEQWSHVKDLSGMAVYTQNGAGATVQFQKDKQTENEWTDVGTLKQEFMSLFPNMNTNDFNKICFRIKGQSIGDPIIYEGMEFLALQDKGYDEN